MSVRVRFAPSPTGYLHIGGLRTALYNYLFAKANNGTFILRIEDTDLERSKREYEELQISDLKWAGVEWQEGPGVEGDFGPYRQSERLDIYKEYTEKLLEQDKAYYCFCTDEEIEKIKEESFKNNLPPQYEQFQGKISLEDARKRIANGEKPAVRFRVPKKDYFLNDLVRGEVKFPMNMVGDFVIMRSNGLPVYNFCCVIDDMLMQISHVIRGEDHLSNTLRQLMVYEALEAKLPEFAHVSLLIGEDRQKLSKRHGATSVNLYREDSYLPQALNNYLCLLGWSHPDEKDVFTMDEIKDIFDAKRFNKAAAIYDLEKLKFINGQHLRLLSNEEILEESLKHFQQGDKFLEQTKEWQLQAVDFFKEKINFFNELREHVNELFDTTIVKEGELVEILSWETTPQIIDYLTTEIQKLSEEKTFCSVDEFNEWSNHIKKELKIKGKQLFKGIRASLTGKGQGPDLKNIIPLTPLVVIKERLTQLK